MSHRKMEDVQKAVGGNDYIKIEDKIDIIPYKTRAYEDNFFANDHNLTEREYAIFVALCTQGIMLALADCINPQNIARWGDAHLKQNYLDVFAFAETMQVVDRT